MIRDILKAMRDYAGGLVAPDLCPVCGSELLDGEHGICLQCLMALPRCMSGSRQILTEFLSNGVAPQGIAASWFRYDSESRIAEVIRRAKYDDRPALMYSLGRQFARELMVEREAGFALSDVDVLLPVPMHWRKRMKRGYNQSEEVARGIAEASGIPVGDNLIAIESHGTQTRRSAAERRANMEGKIGVEAPAELDGLNIAIVDDIVTTGATVFECVRAISRSGARPATIGVLSLAISARNI